MMDADPSGHPMTGRLLAAVFRQAEALAAQPGAYAPGSPADADLVRRFAASRDEAAFAALVRRHGPMVWAVCRNLLSDEADAEDAFQATFLALVRGAGTIRTPAAVGAWLHGVAVKVATQAKRSAARRKHREEAAAVPEGGRPARPADDWAELHAAVHDEVGRLPDRERAVFVLCGLEGVRQPDAAAHLGLKLNTVSGLLARARRRLLDRLTKRGLTPAAAAAAAAVGTTPAAAVPDSITDGALSLARAADAAAGVSGIVLELARGATEGSMTGTKLLAAAAVLAAALGVGTGAAVLSGALAQDGGGGGPGFPGAAGAPPGAPGGAGLPSGGPGAPAAGMPGGYPGMMAGMGMPGGPTAGAAAESVRWEYKTVARKGAWDQLLAKLGDDGWEVVCATAYTPGSEFQGQTASELLLKRPKRAAAAGGMTGMGGGPMPSGAGGMGAMGGAAGPGMPRGLGGPGASGPGAGAPGGGVPGRGRPGGGRGGLGSPDGGSNTTGSADGGGITSNPGGSDSSVTMKRILKHLRVADLTPAVRKQLSVTKVDEQTNSVTISGETVEAVQLAAEFLVQLDTAAGKARK